MLNGDSRDSVEQLLVRKVGHDELAVGGEVSRVDGDLLRRLLNTLAGGHGVGEDKSWHGQKSSLLRGTVHDGDPIGRDAKLIGLIIPDTRRFLAQQAIGAEISGPHSLAARWPVEWR